MFIYIPFKGGNLYNLLQKGFRQRLASQHRKGKQDEHLTSGNFVSKCKNHCYLKTYICFVLFFFSPNSRGYYYN